MKQKSCKADDKECFMKFKKMAGTCMEKKCSQKPSCEDACAAKAKAGAQKKCKKDDKECLNKFKQMAAKCVEAKCSGMMKTFILSLFLQLNSWINSDSYMIQKL